MAHHKCKRPKNRRAGCLLCKPWKMNGFAKGRVDAESLSDHRRRFDAEKQLEETRGTDVFSNLWLSLMRTKSSGSAWKASAGLVASAGHECPTKSEDNSICWSLPAR